MNHHQEELPYGNKSPTSGHAGSDTSRERAEQADRTGLTGERQLQALAELVKAESSGLTWAEFGQIASLHHGASSGTLSGLHKAGRIIRLSERRGGSKVYVHPDYVRGRDTEPAGNTTATDMLAEMYDLLNEADQGWNDIGISVAALREWHRRANDVMRRYEATRK